MRGVGRPFGSAGTVSHMSEPADAPVILSDEPGSFPWSVLAERHPALVRKVRDAFPYGPEQHRALDALLKKNATEGVIEPLGERAAGSREQWERWGGEEYAGRSWFDVPFLSSESYFYRQLLEAVGYFTPAPGRASTPSAPQARGAQRPGGGRGARRARPARRAAGRGARGGAAARLAVGQPRGPRLPSRRRGRGIGHRRRTGRQRR